VLPVEAGARRAAQAAKAALAAGAGGGSDHLALVRAFNSWAAARAAGGGGDRRSLLSHRPGPAPHTDLVLHLTTTYMSFP